MRIQWVYPIATGILISSAYVLTGCSTHEESQVGQVGKPPQSAGLENDDGPARETEDGEGATTLSLLANAANAANADNVGNHASACGDDAGTQCNALLRQPCDAPYYVRLNEPWPGFETYSGGVIQDGVYVLTEDNYYPPYPQGMDPIGTSWTTLKVTGNVLSAFVTDHQGGEERFNATMELNGSRIYLTPLCALEYTAKNEWKELKFPFIRSGYTATEDTLTISWMIGNHAAVRKVFHRAHGTNTGSETL